MRGCSNNPHLPTLPFSSGDHSERALSSSDPEKQRWLVQEAQITRTDSKGFWDEDSSSGLTTLETRLFLHLVLLTQPAEMCSSICFFMVSNGVKLLAEAAFPSQPCCTLERANISMLNFFFFCFFYSRIVYCIFLFCMKVLILLCTGIMFMLGRFKGPKTSYNFPIFSFNMCTLVVGTSCHSPVCLPHKLFLPLLLGF